MSDYIFSKLLIISGWMILILLAYKVSQFDYEYANFDPYEILGVPLVSNELNMFIVSLPKKGWFSQHIYKVHILVDFPIS
jgi:hypothetical protein